MLVAPPLLAATAAAVVSRLDCSVLAPLGRAESANIQVPQSIRLLDRGRFALFLGAVIVVGRVVGEWLGGIGAIVGAAIVGLVDVDAITVSVARLAPEPLGNQAATIAILSAVATDTISKVAIGGVIGRGRFALEISAMALACFAAGAVALWMTLAILET